MALAIECGATSSDVFLVDDNGKIQEQFHFGSANYRLLDETKLENFFKNIREHFLSFSIHSIGIGMPGIVDTKDKEFVFKLMSKIWPELESLWVGNDLETALACLDDNEYEIKTIIVAGTGSCSYGTTRGATGKVGGYGHRIGDRGSAYAISEKALRLALRQHEYNCPLMQTVDSEEICSNLLATIMNHLGIHSLKELIMWSLSAKKDDISQIAPIVLLMWKQNDETAKSVIEESITYLGDDCLCLIKKLRKCYHSYIVDEMPAVNISIGLTGSLFSKDLDFAEAFKKKLLSGIFLQGVGKVSIKILHNTALGSLKKLDTFRRKNISCTELITQSTVILSEVTEVPKENEKYLAETILPVALGLSLTERRNEKSMNLDRMDVEEAIDLMISEEQNIFDKISEHKKSIGILIEKVSKAFQNGGRLFYVGAGTSGRLGILDATECPPTFKSPYEWVQGIIAGGFSTVFISKEGAEDSILDGMKAIDEKNINRKDIVVGIAASGTTPFVWGAIHRAKCLDAFTAFLTFNTELELKVQPDVFMAMNLGAEILTGSTRLKCGTATKCILNMLSTLAMVKHGKCFENLMVDLNPANEKLKLRSLRIVLLMTSQVKNINEMKVKEVLLRNAYDIRKTVKELRGDQ